MSIFFFFNDTATTEIYTLSLHDALPICAPRLWLLAGYHGNGGIDIAGPLGKAPTFVRWLVDCRAACDGRSEEHTSELQSQSNLVCRLLLEKKKTFTRRLPSGLHVTRLLH